MNFSVSMVSWGQAEADLRRLRETVFMREQGVTAELEWDGLDDQCRHALARDEAGQAIGCGRLLPDGHIGRMAVLKHWRGRKVGSAIMAALLEEAQACGLRQLALDAQTHAVPFYRRFGFEETGEEFMDAGMPHIRMQRWLKPE